MDGEHPASTRHRQKHKKTMPNDAPSCQRNATEQNNQRPMETTTLQNLKKKLIRELPFFPNNKETLQELEKQHTGDVLLHYLHWKTRLVPARPRKVQVAPEVTNDKRWKKARTGATEFLDKIRRGDDITPHLSKRIHQYGYTPSQRIRSGEVDSWIDKDQLLNTTGLHHFHLGMNIQTTGLSERTDEVLFAHVSRDKFHAIGIFDHSVFKQPCDNEESSKERKRLWELHRKYSSIGIPEGSAFLSNPIMCSGHPLQVVRSADIYWQIICENDKKLQEIAFAKELYANKNSPPPKKFKLEWYVHGLDLGILDKRNNCLFILIQGPT